MNKTLLTMSFLALTALLPYTVQAMEDETEQKRSVPTAAAPQHITEEGGSSSSIRSALIHSITIQPYFNLMRETEIPFTDGPNGPLLEMYLPGNYHIIADAHGGTVNLEEPIDAKETFTSMIDGYPYYHPGRGDISPNIQQIQSGPSSWYLRPVQAPWTNASIVNGRVKAMLHIGARKAVKFVDSVTEVYVNGELWKSKTASRSVSISPEEDASTAAIRRIQASIPTIDEIRNGSLVMRLAATSHLDSLGEVVYQYYLNGVKD